MLACDRKIIMYLDGNIDIIQNAVREHFLIQHISAGHPLDQFEVKFFPKTSSVQTGFTCHVLNGSFKTQYFVKTNQYVPSEGTMKSVQIPDAKEVYVYKLLELIGIGPEAHIIVPRHGTKLTIYISTKDTTLLRAPEEFKQNVVVESLREWDLLAKIKQAAAEISGTISKIGDEEILRVLLRRYPRN